MAEDQPRGGRGQYILEMMRKNALEKRPGPQEADEQPQQQSAPIPPSLSRGRASLMNLCKKVPESSPTTVRPPGAAPASLPPTTGVSKGRAALFAYAQRTSPPGSTKQAQEEPVAGVLGPLAELSMDTSRTSCQESTTIAESEPVSRTGESGKITNMTANYIRMAIEPGKGVFEYEVRFSPDIDSRPFRLKLLNQHLTALGGTKTFDGVKLYLPVKLPQERSVFRSDHPSNGTPVTITVIFKKQSRLGDLHHLFNILFRRVMYALQLVRIGRNDFNARAAVPVPQHKLELWPGYITAVDEYEGGLMLCLDSTHRVLRNETVHDLMKDVYTRDKQNFQDTVMKEIIGTTVLTRYNNKTYRIDDIYWDMNPLWEFKMKDDTSVTYMEYYKNHWNVIIKDVKQPLLLHRGKTRSPTGEVSESIACLIPELCYMSGLTDSMRADFRVMKDLASVTRIAPDARRDTIRRFIQEVKKNEVANNLLASWGLHMEDDIVPLKGRLLQPETILFGKGRNVDGQTNADWSSAATRNPMLHTPNLKSWCLIYFERDTRCAGDFAETLIKVGPSMGMDISPARCVVLRSDRTESFLTALRQNINPQVELMVIICPTNRNDRYAAIKKLCCVEMPIASQVIISKTICRADRLRSVTQKIALQINCKLGGTLWALKIPFDNLMVCGVDVHHAGVGQGTRGSVGAFVSSLDKQLTRWYSKVCLQGPHQELIDSLKMCLIAGLKAYYAENKRFPDRIIMYRDGVGDGQLEVVRNYEITQLLQSFALIDPEYQPKLSVVIVQKRISTRLFQKTGMRLDNPPPGSIIDHTVTRRNLYDFFLVSQSVRQGTVSPTHYIVIYDGIGLKTDHMQRLTYKLCHLYFNWPGTVRVPAPCQYAHKLAFLVGQSIQMEPHKSLSNKLYFL